MVLSEFSSKYDIFSAAFSTADCPVLHQKENIWDPAGSRAATAARQPRCLGSGPPGKADNLSATKSSASRVDPRLGVRVLPKGGCRAAERPPQGIRQHNLPAHMIPSQRNSTNGPWRHPPGAAVWPQAFCASLSGSRGRYMPGRLRAGIAA